VSRERCEKCGFVYDLLPVDIVVALRSFPRRYRTEFAFLNEDPDADALVRQSPPSGGWSALGYAGHTADIFDRVDDRIRRALHEDRPQLPLIDEDERAAGRAVDQRAVDDVLDELEANDNRLVATIESVRDDAWHRPAILGSGREVDVLWLAQTSVHEASHHLRDVQRVLDGVGARRDH
jgi:hypothetical protein